MSWRAAVARLVAARVDSLVGGGVAGVGDVAVVMRAASDMPL